MRVLVTGSNGMLGSSLVAELMRHHDVSGLANRESKDFQIPFHRADISIKPEVSEVIHKIRPDVIVHTAAHVDADDCERNPERAYAVNTDGTRWIAEASKAVGALLFFISSDYVFDGTKKEPYREVDLPNPLSVYGKSKTLAEDFLRSMNFGAYVIRVSWLFGEHGSNFFSTILKKICADENLKVVDDQIGAPTYTKDLAKPLRLMAEKAWARNLREGVHIYHIANAGKTSWFDATKVILEKVNSPVQLERISSHQLVREAKRPLNSVFDMSKIKQDFGIEMRSWRYALEEYWDQSLKVEWERRFSHKEVRK
ncbi:MAG: dTDP-4-dehydrorhamnose reductase [Candidatus Omnitrophica bacterium]|nr:dTDP-4-dehydrorhamnose reductase [Candidatus Omnitrophota bacterium]